MPYTPGNNKQILVGAAAFFISHTQAALPDLSVVGKAADLIADAPVVAPATEKPWATVGYTENGVTVSYEPTYGDVTVDQLLDSAVVFKSGMKVTVNTTFAEATLENLLVVWGQKGPESGPDSTLDADGTLHIDGGGLGDFPHERALAFVGPSPRNAANTERVYYINRAIQTQTTAHDLKRDAATTLPVSFRCLPADDGRYGTVRDRAATA